MVLKDYANLIGVAAGLAAFCLNLAPAFVCKTIIKKKSTKDIPVGSFIECIARNVMCVQQGLIISAWPMVLSNVIGIVLNSSYIYIYLTYTTNKVYVMKILSFWAAVLSIFIAYGQLEDKALVEWRFGLLFTSFNCSIVLYHFYRLKVVLETKSTKSLPFPILVVAACVTFLWFLYGMALNKPLLMLPTGISFLMCSTSLILFAIYPSSPDEELHKKKK
uniref:Sugar transporter SWEET1 n=1 Tax=Clastoptera arizonana TaxID=38151 RepID=A0A1B6C523_9HEMI